MKVSIRRDADGKLRNNPLLVEIWGEEHCFDYENGRTLVRTLSIALDQIEAQMRTLDEIQGVMKR